MRYDYLIVGQGIAGTILSYTLYKEGKTIFVLDAGGKNSSQAAAGIYNPLTGQRIVKTWEADNLFPFLQSFYLEFEKFLHAHFFHPIPLYRLFESVEEQNNWMGKASEESFKWMVELNIDRSVYDPWITDLHGGLRCLHSGYIDVQTMLKAWKFFLVQQVLYKEGYFDKNKLTLFSDHVEYDDIQATRLIFCDGVHALSNSFFEWLPFNLVKGELLKITLEKPVHVIFNKGIFILPINDHEALVGATYNWGDQTSLCTDQARNELKEKLHQFYKLPYTIVDQWAGIRPTTRDRRPFIGLHPSFLNIGIFNGLGTKGISLAPYFAHHFYTYLEHHKQLHQEVQINRYFSLYSNGKK